MHPLPTHLRRKRPSQRRRHRKRRKWSSGRILRNRQRVADVCEGRRWPRVRLCRRRCEDGALAVDHPRFVHSIERDGCVSQLLARPHRRPRVFGDPAVLPSERVRPTWGDDAAFVLDARADLPCPEEVVAVERVHRGFDEGLEAGFAVGVPGFPAFPGVARAFAELEVEIGGNAYFVQGPAVTDVSLQSTEKASRNLPAIVDSR